MLEETVLLQQPVRFRAEAGEKQLQNFIEETRGRHAIQQVREFPNWLFGAGINREIEFRRETHRAQHAHRIFAVARLGIADQLEAPRLDVAHAIDKIPNGEVFDTVVEAICRKIAAPDVFLDRAVDVVAKNSPRLIKSAMFGIM